MKALQCIHAYQETLLYINVLITPPAQFAIGAARAVAETHQIASNSTRNKCTGDSTLLREVCDLIFEACEQDHNIRIHQG